MCARDPTIWARPPLENRIALRAVCPAPSRRPALLKRGIELGGKRFASWPTIDRLVPSASRRIGLYKTAVHNDHGFFYGLWHVDLACGSTARKSLGLLRERR